MSIKNKILTCLEDKIALCENPLQNEIAIKMFLSNTERIEFLGEELFHLEDYSWSFEAIKEYEEYILHLKYLPQGAIFPVTYGYLFGSENDKIAVGGEYYLGQLSKSLGSNEKNEEMFYSGEINHDGWILEFEGDLCEEDILSSIVKINKIY